MTTDANRTEAALALSRRILALARQHDHPALLAIDADPETASLLAILNGDLASAALVHLEGARAWRRRKEEANQRRLTEARAALEGFDLVRARSLLFRIEEEFLSSQGIDDRDAVLLEFEARTMESEELRETADDIIDEYQPLWRRWRRKRR